MEAPWAPKSQMSHVEALTSIGAQLPFAEAIARCGLRKSVVRDVEPTSASSSSTSKRDYVTEARKCLAAVLRCPLFTSLGGQPGKSRSLASPHAGSALRMMGCGSTRDMFGLRKRAFVYSNFDFDVPSDLMQVVVPHAADAFQVPTASRVAVTCDGTRVIVTKPFPFGKDTMGVVRVADAVVEHEMPCDEQCYVHVAPDDYVFVAEPTAMHVRELTPRFELVKFIGAGHFRTAPCAVCANDSIVVVAEELAPALAVFSRGDGALLRRIGEDWLHRPQSMCFMHDNRAIAVANIDVGDDRMSWDGRVTILGVMGDFQRHIKASCHATRAAFDVACTRYGELVVNHYHGADIYGSSGDVFTCTYHTSGLVLVPPWLSALRRRDAKFEMEDTASPAVTTIKRWPVGVYRACGCDVCESDDNDDDGASAMSD